MIAAIRPCRCTNSSVDFWTTFKDATLGAVVAASLLFVGPAFAEYPTKPISLIVPFAAGGTSDILARKAAEVLRAAGGQAVIVDNKPGAGGTIASKFVARSRADGYTLVITPSATMAVAPTIHKDFDASELTPVSVLVEVPFGFFAKTDLAANDLPTLVALAKKDPSAARVAVTSLGSHGHLTALLFARATGTQLMTIPYKGTAPAMADLVGGHVDTLVSDIGAMIPTVDSGKVKVLFVTAPARLPKWPNVPTAKEQGLNFESSAWFGIAAPKGTPPEVVQFIQQVLAKGIGQNLVEREKLIEIGLTPVFSTPSQALAILKKDEASLGKLAATLNLQNN